MKGYWNRIAILSCLACTMVIGCLRTAPVDLPRGEPVVRRVEARKLRAERISARSSALAAMQGDALANRPATD